ncbi:MAG: ABC transporter ATP-binding protein [Chloroflexi bacterium]|nr:MAG: ABC transporter ATP-binding protein [Chloroflexota bacterium]
MVRLEGVTVSLGRRTILQGVSGSVRAGEFVVVLGPNGAGKTTLLRAITGLIPLAAGTVQVAGHPARRGDPCIGYVPQRRPLDPDLPLRGVELVALGLDGHRWGIPVPDARDRERVARMIAAVGAESYADGPAGRLSGGEQQRLFLAQALAGDPQLLLLDEPTASLDLHHQRELLDLIARVSRERRTAVMLVAHDVNPLLSILDRVWYLAGGQPSLRVAGRCLLGGWPSIRFRGRPPCLIPSISSSCRTPTSPAA